MKLPQPHLHRRLAFALVLFGLMNLACSSLFAVSSRAPTPTAVAVATAPPLLITPAAVRLVPTAVAEAGAAADASPNAPLGAELAVRSVYTGMLAPLWVNWSWDATIGFADGSAAAATASAATAQAIAVTYQAPWAALYLHSEEAIPANAFDRLRFRLHGGPEGGQRLIVALADAGGAFQSTGVAVSAAANAWTTVEVPLANAGDLTHITGIAWQDASGEQQPTFYLDAIELVDISLPPTPTPAPLAGPALRVDASTTIR